MKSKSTLSKGAMIYGIVLTSLMLLAFGSKLIVSLVENGVEELINRIIQPLQVI